MEETSARWEKEVFHKLQLRDKHKLLPRLIGTIYTLKFELGLPLFLNFVLVAARVNTNWLFRGRRLREALELLCERGGFRNEECMILCHDFQLEIPGRVSPDAQDCMDRLYRARGTFSNPERDALADWYLFQYGTGFYERGNFDAAAAACEKSIKLRWDFCEAYYNWGLALSDLARLRQDEGLLKQGAEKFMKALEIDPDDLEAHFNLACSYALRELVAETCDSLDSAFSLSPEVVNNVRANADFDPIRDDPIFQQWLREHGGNSDG